MGISVPMARAMMNHEGFPMIRAGRYSVIPRSSLEDWLRKQAEEQNQCSN